MTIAKIAICENGSRETEKNHSALIPRISCRSNKSFLIVSVFQFQVKSEDSDIDVELYKKKKRKIKILFKRGLIKTANFKIKLQLKLSPINGIIREKRY